jgi:hypothetical protein
MGNCIIRVGDALVRTLFLLPCKLAVSDRDKRGWGLFPVVELTLIRPHSPIRRSC